MAACTSKPPIPMSLPSQGETWHSRGPTCYQFLNFGSKSRVRTGKLSCCVAVRLERSKKGKYLVRGCGCERSSNNNGEEYYCVTEEDQDFVKVLRESQPYISVHRDSVFVVVISAEMVASPYLDAILKVTCATAVEAVCKGFNLDN